MNILPPETKYLSNKSMQAFNQTQTSAMPWLNSQGIEG